MSINREKPHLLVLPEDQANSEMANGFLLDLRLDTTRIQVLSPVGGWMTATKELNNTLVPHLRHYSSGFVVLLIDFDRDANRLNYIYQEIYQEIPEDLKSRIFIIGVFSEPEELKKSIKKSLEDIGEMLAKDCAENTDTLWAHELLKHNKEELDRLRIQVKGFLFN